MLSNKGQRMLTITEKTIETAKKVLDIEAKSIIDLKNRLGREIEDAVEILYNCKGRVIVTGMGKSGHIGRKIAATLSSTGTPSYFLHPAESTHGDSGILTREDVVIAISNSGETQELMNLLPLIKRFSIPLISMTGKSESTLAKSGDVLLNISVEKEACPLGKAPTASTTVTLALGDALAICLLKKRGFSEEDFLMYHPSGALGKKKLINVKDLMISDERLPIISQEKSFLDVVKFISEKKLGCAILIDENGCMQGVLTDGDIRRILLAHPDVSSLVSKDVMTKNPKTVTAESIATKALAIMEKYSITSLAVVDENNRPVGIVHVHDLLKEGVA